LKNKQPPSTLHYKSACAVHCEMQ